MKRIAFALLLGPAAAACSSQNGVTPYAVHPAGAVAEARPGDTTYPVYLSLAGGVPKSGPNAAVRSLTVAAFDSKAAPRTWNLSPTKCTQNLTCDFKFNLSYQREALVVRSYDRGDGKGKLLSTTVVSYLYAPGIGLTLSPKVETASINFANPNPPYGTPVRVVLQGVGHDALGDFIIGPAPYDRSIVLSSTGQIRLSSSRAANAVQPLWAKYGGSYENGVVSVVSYISTPPGGSTSEAVRPMLQSSWRQSSLAPSSNLAAASDGSVWGIVNCALVKIDRALTPQPAPVPTSLTCPTDLTKGPDGHVWFSASSPSFGRGGAAGIGDVAPDGTITGYPAPSSGSGTFGAIATGPDGNLWTVDQIQGTIFRITTSGAFTTAAYSLSAPYANGIVAGPDGNLWITDWYGQNYGFWKVNTAGQLVAHYQVQATGPMLAKGKYVYAAIAGNGPSVGAFDGTGRLVRNFKALDVANGINGHQLALGRDGAIWCEVETYSTYQAPLPVAILGRISSAGTYAEVAIPTGAFSPGTDISGLATGGDGDLYYVLGQTIGKIVIH